MITDPGLLVLVKMIPGERSRGTRRGMTGDEFRAAAPGPADVRPAPGPAG